MISRTYPLFGWQTRRRLTLFLTTSLVLAGLAGCRTVADESDSPVLEEPVTEAPAKTIDLAVLHNLLDTAEAAIDAGQLTYPADGSALAIYQQILAIEPGQQDAERGLEHLVELYIDLAMTALQRGRSATARSMLSRARLIRPNHPSIEPTAAQIRLLDKADRKTLQLTQADLQGRTKQMQDNLAALAILPAGQACRYTIWAKNDAQGRWIYQRLAAASASGRIRAQINLRLPAGVERLCFPK